MRAMMVLVVALGGCSDFFSQYRSDTSTSNLMRTYPHEIHYDLLTVTTASACENYDDISRVKGIAFDSRSIGHPLLFESAKYAAIERIDTCDGLIGLRAKVNYKGTNQCVTVTGRCYHITYLRASPGTDSTITPEVK